MVINSYKKCINESYKNDYHSFISDSLMQALQIQYKIRL